MTLKYAKDTVVSPESCRVAMYVKCSEDRDRMNRKSPFSTTPLSFDAPSPANPANICINLILPETTFPGRSLGYVFVADSIWVALQIFEHFCRKAGDTNTLVAEPETVLMQNGQSTSLKVE